ncbi:hypothetical protein GWL_18380 [Herbaspirillum sp. GW103]|uniref:hypothetical protein n=1 Tax=Herbaspirillum sp. GW103 TaxID=1175306 RepID=UPI00025E2ECC|nr:hypothetical protein [Herbaspirillum sp. GW103]EIJ47597.1 hypothetical protein GWL_18380 [Herbaspirillum sp. GW103]
MVAASAAEQSAISHAAGNAAIAQSLFLLKTDREAVRAAHWNSLPEQTRKYICHMAGIGAERGALPLRELDAFQRGKVNRTADRLIRELETLMRCMQGGSIPAPAAA